MVPFGWCWILIWWSFSGLLRLLNRAARPFSSVGLLRLQRSLVLGTQVCALLRLYTACYNITRCEGLNGSVSNTLLFFVSHCEQLSLGCLGWALVTCHQKWLLNNDLAHEAREPPEGA